MQVNNDNNISVNIIEKVMVVNIDSELDEVMLAKIEVEILDRFYENHIVGIIIDLAGLMIIDSFIVKKILTIIHALKFMGGYPIISGIRPEVIITLITMDFPLDDIVAVLNVDEGIKMIKKKYRKNDEIEKEL
ncbi:MAG: rsbT antagonist protein RsbS, partial [Saprospiraceae bacterium]